LDESLLASSPECDGERETVGEFDWEAFLRSCSTKEMEPVMCSTKEMEPLMSSTKEKERIMSSTKEKERIMSSTKEMEPLVSSTKEMEHAMYSTKIQDEPEVLKTGTGPEGGPGRGGNVVWAAV